MDFDRVLAAKRAVEICMKSKEPYNNLTMESALKQTAREFSEEVNKKDDIKGVIREFI